MNRLKELRKENNITLRDLAKKININYASLSRMENSVQAIDNNSLVLLCNFFNTTSDYILGLSNIREQRPKISDKLNFANMPFDENILKELVNIICYLYQDRIVDNDTLNHELNELNKKFKEMFSDAFNNIFKEINRSFDNAFKDTLVKIAKNTTIEKPDNTTKKEDQQ